MKTTVIMIGVDQYKNWTIGDEGYIDGYIRGANNTPLAVVVIGKRLVLSPLTCIEVTGKI